MAAKLSVPIWAKLAVALVGWSVLLVVGNLSFGALTITDPGTGKQIKIHTMYSYRGTGASTGNPPKAVEVRLYKSAAMSEEKGFGASYPGSDGSFNAGAEYTGEVSQAGYVLAQQGAASDDEYVEWISN